MTCASSETTRRPCFATSPSEPAARWKGPCASGRSRAAYAPLLAQRMIFISGGAFTPSASSYLVRVKNLKLEKPFDMREVRRLVAERVAHAQRDGATSSAASTSG